MLDIKVTKTTAPKAKPRPGERPMPVPKHLRAEDADEVDGQQRMY